MPTGTKKVTGFSDEERKAMQARAKELAAEAKANKTREAGEKALLEAIAGMSGSDKVIAKRLHEIISKNVPSLSPKTWYGFPAYTKDDKVVCFFQFAGKFKSRYATLGFSDVAKLDDGNMWPVAYALTKLTESEEKKVITMVKHAIGE